MNRRNAVLSAPLTSTVLFLAPCCTVGSGCSRRPNPRSSSPIRSPAWATARVVAYDDESTQELWTFNLGSGINAPPMTFEVGGRQYRAIMTGLSQMNEMRNQTMLFLSAL